MRVGRLERDGSPERPGHLRLAARVAYDDGGAETVWFDVPETLGDRVTRRADPFLVALLPVAVTRHEPLRIASGAVDPVLPARLRELMRLWACWDPGLAPVPLEAETGEGPGPVGGADEPVDAALFSGGVDSLYTASCDRQGLPPERRVRIRDLLTVHGFDLPLASRAAFDRVRARHERFAERRGLRSIAIATNLRRTRFADADWATLAHGPALAAAALALGPGLRTVLIAASSGYRDLRPWGSHPLVDPLLSTSATRFVHDGAGIRRLDKLREVCRSESALSVLRVCWESETEENCGRCLKCSRTLLGLELLGARGRAPTFAHVRLDLDRIASLRPESPFDIRELEDLRALAGERGRAEIEAAVEAALRGAGSDGTVRGAVRSLLRGLAPSRSGEASS